MQRQLEVREARRELILVHFGATHRRIEVVPDEVREEREPADEEPHVLVEVDRDNFDDVMERMGAQLETIRFKELDDFHPDRLYQKLRIFQGLKPDVVAIQEFSFSNNTPADFRYLLDTAFGPEFVYYRETGYDTGIPNGIISRYPIIASGSWDDPLISNRGFAWARIDLPGTNDLYVVSVHLYNSGTAADRKVYNIVQLIYRARNHEGQSKDYEFSRLSMQEHWAAGRADMAHTLHDARWVHHERSKTGVHVFDLTSDSSTPPRKATGNS